MPEPFWPAVNDPRKHHYIPVFYLEQWAGADGRLCQYWKPWANKVVPNRRHPEATGFQLDLYSVPGLPSNLAHIVEYRFMRRLDTAAANAMRNILVAQATPWTTNTRSDWSRFLLSLLFRNPETIALLRTHSAAMWDNGLAYTKENYASFRRPDDPLTYEEFLAKTDPLAADKAAMIMAQDIIDSSRVGPTLNSMVWQTVRLEASSVSLFTSDRPLDMPHGLASKEAYIALPVGPKTLFVAAHDDRWEKRLIATDPTHIVKQVNLAVVTQARKFVWGVDDRQLRFVQNQMSTAPDRVIITEEQKRKSINVAAAGS